MKSKQDGDDLFDRLTVSISFLWKTKIMLKKNHYNFYIGKYTSSSTWELYSELIQGDNRHNVRASLSQMLQ